MIIFRSFIKIFCLFHISVTIIPGQSKGIGEPVKANVEVRFMVIVPDYTPEDDAVFMYGSMNNWDPGDEVLPDSTDLKMNKVSRISWELTLFLKNLTTYEYKYTRGSLKTIDNNADSTDSKVRKVFVDGEIGDIVIYDTVYSWNDFTLPPEPENTTPVLSFYNSLPQTSIAVSWVADSSSNSKIYYGINDVSENSKLVSENLDLINTGDALMHNVLLDNLLPNTKYKYKVETEGVYESPEYSFTTAGYTDKFEFDVMGDNRPGIDTSVMKQVVENDPEFVLHLGDLVQNGLKLSDWYRFLGDYSEMLGRLPIMPIYGNHEEDVYMNEFFKLPSNNSPDSSNHGHWYAFDFNNVRIIALDPYRDYYEGSEQYNWFIEQLSTLPDSIDHKFVLIHEPPFTSGNHHGPNTEIRDILVPVIEKYNVDVVFNGHEHIYERSMVNGIPYIVSGGAGSPLYFVTGGANPYSVIAESVYHYCRVFIDGKNFKIQMVRSNGSIGDEYEVVKEHARTIPTKINLDQNYPNPFNPVTSIRYSIVTREFVSLKVYDILGRETAVLINGVVDEGVHEVKFNAANLASGVYFYKLTVGNKEFIKKLIVLK